jgi:hypothetical protein
MGFSLGSSDYNNLKNSVTALNSFVNAAANAFATTLSSQSGAGTVSVSGTADPLSRRRLLQSNTVNINFVITFPAGTSATTVDAAVAKVVSQVNTQGVSALGVTSLGGVTPTGVTASVTTSRSTGGCIGLGSWTADHQATTAAFMGMYVAQGASSLTDPMFLCCYVCRWQWHTSRVLHWQQLQLQLQH